MKIDLVGLEMIEFHDLPLNKIIIEFDPNPKMELSISIYDEDIRDYYETIITFDELTQMNLQNLEIQDFTSAEIYSFDYELLGDLFYGKMLCLFGLSEPSLEIEFYCRKVELIR